VVAAIGLREARRLFVTGEVFDAAEARRIGLLHAVVSGSELDEAIERQLYLLAKAGPLAQREAKQLALRIGGADLAEAERIDTANAELIARLRVSPEGQHGLAAFLDKRAPAWVGHAT
jgi:methylglutaconyl-CoA hydratase